MKMRLVLAGFGTVGQGLTELLLERERIPKGLEISVVGISDMIKGSLHAPGGIDLAGALERAKAGKKISEAGDAFDGDALQLIGGAEADMLVEATYTDLETAEPATSHVRAALEKGMQGDDPDAVYDLLEDIALRGKMGRRVRIPTGCLARLALGLFSSLALLLVL